MRVVHVVVLLAVLVVGALVYVMLDAGPDSRRDRPGARPEAAPAGAETDTGTPGAVPGLVVTATLELPSGRPADGAAVEIAGPRTEIVRADASGSVRAAGLPAGDYTLLARLGGAALTHAFTLRAPRDLGTLRLRAALLVRGHVRDTRGRALAGAVVEALPEPSVGASFRPFVRPPGAADAPSARARSDGDGAYELALPAAGEYVLRADAKDHAPAQRPSEPFAAPRDGVDFHLADGVAVRGTVRAADGALLPGAHVMIAMWTRGGTRHLSRYTGADGTFALVAATRSRLSFTVRAAGHALFTRSNVRVPTPLLDFRLEDGVTVRLRAVAADTRAPAAGVAVILQYRSGHAEGETDERGEAVFEGQPSIGARHARNDLYIVGGAYAPRRISLRDREPAAGMVDLGDVALEPAGVVTGRVLARADRRPIEGAKVIVATQDWMATALVNPSARTDASGAFRLAGVPLGAAVLVASHPDFVGADDFSKLYARLRTHGDSLFAKGARTAEHDILLVGAATLTGLVVDPEGEPVPGARVERFVAANPLDALLETKPRIAVTDGAGRFVLEGLRANEPVDLVATHPQHGASDRVTLSAAQNVAPTLRLTPVLTLTGRVVDADARPVAGAQVDVRVPRGRTGARPHAGATGADGGFVIRNVPAGDLTVAVDHGSFQPFAERVTVRDDTPTTDMGALTLARGPHLAGLVTDGAGRPLAGVFVDCFLPGPPRAGATGRRWAQARTDEAGRFDVAGLVDGEYRLTPRRDGWFGERRTVAANTDDVRLVMRRAATLRGRVVHDGAPVAGARIEALAGAERLNTAQAKADGAFELTGLPPDAGFTLRIRHPSYEALRVEGVRARDGTQEFTLAQGVQVGGIVVDAAGDPVAGVVVAVRAADSAAQSGRTDERGAFLLGGLSAGPLTLAVSWVPGRYLPPSPRPVEAGDRAVRVVLRPGLSIRGAIVDAAGNAARNVIVQAVRDGQVAGATYVRGGAGTFEIARLAAGAYALRVVDGATQRVLTERTGIAAGADGVQLRVTK